MKHLLLAALLGTVAAGGVAVAQTPAAPIAKPMKGDADADGKVSKSEFLRLSEARFARLDVDRDGMLTRDEARAGHRPGGKRGRFGAIGQDGPPPPPGAMRGGGMLRQDSDGDGKVSRAEFDAETTKMFARMDANGDGTVDKVEMAALPGGGRMAMRADTNGDGAVTRAEFAALSAQRFGRMDSNADGVIDAAELPARPGGRGGAGRPGNPAPPTGA